LGKLLETKTFLDLLKKRGKSKLVTVDFDSGLEKAIKLMRKKDYSQLPVIKEDKVIGVLSYKSLVYSMLTSIGNKSKSPFKIKVEDCMGKVSKTFGIEEDILNLLDSLANESFVLIENKEDGIVDIITSYDALDFFRKCGEDFLILNDVEDNLRKIILEKFDSNSFCESAKRIFSCKEKTSPPNARFPKKINDLEFSQYTTFICSNREDFKKILEDKKIFSKYMGEARKIRNKICHFKGSIENKDKDFLKNFLTWLETKSSE
jgi:predicted transcriptional regulator